MKQYLKTQANGEAIEVVANDGLGVAVETIAAATTLTAEDSGKEFILSAAAGAAISLPSPIAGWKAKFRVGSAFATTNWTIVAATNVIQGYAAVNYATVAAADENTISFVATAETIGDWVELVCDGTDFHVFGVGNSAGAITFTAP